MGQLGILWDWDIVQVLLINKQVCHDTWVELRTKHKVLTKKQQQEQVFCVYLTQAANWQCTGVCGLLPHASRHLLTFNSDIGHTEVNPKWNPVVESQKDLSVRCLCLWGLFHLLTYTACSLLPTTLTTVSLSSIIEPCKNRELFVTFSRTLVLSLNGKLSKTTWAANSMLCNVMGDKRCPVCESTNHTFHHNHIIPPDLPSPKLQCIQAYLMAMHQLSVSVIGLVDRPTQTSLQPNLSIYTVQPECMSRWVLNTNVCEINLLHTYNVTHLQCYIYITLDSSLASTAHLEWNRSESLYLKSSLFYRSNNT